MRTLLLSMVMLGVCVAVAHPDSALFNYQGRLLDDGGQPVNQAVTVSINICTSLTSATEYAEDVGSVIVQNGLFTFSYGTNSPAIRQVLNGKEGWLELVIDGTPLAPRQRLHSAAFAMSLDENSLVQSTKFLLDMIAKHELEIQALRANSGLANTSGGNQYFVETFPDANGLNDLIDTASTTAIYNPTNQLYVAGDAGAARVITVSNAWYSTSCWSVAWYVTNINDSVQTVNGDIAFDGEGTPTNPVVFVWQYGTGVSLTNSPIILCTNGMRQSFAVTNPNPEGFVTQLKMGMPDSVPGCWEPYLMEITPLYIHAGESAPLTLDVVLHIPSVTSRCSHATLYVNEVNGSGVDAIRVDLTDGSTSVTNIRVGQKASLLALSNNPTTAFIRLTADGTPEQPDPAIESIMYKWWSE